jgi:hypothetical protein
MGCQAIQVGEKGSFALLRSIASLQRTAQVRLRSSISHAPRSWTFLTSLIAELFNNF